MKHTTHHAAEAVNGIVWAGCQDCDWSEAIDVRGLTWLQAMTKIYEARDAHADAIAYLATR
jgi:hypothetical protein